MLNLNGKVAIITGASSGLGRAAAIAFSRAGARLVLAGRREEALQQVLGAIREVGGQALALSGDVRDESFHRSLVARARAEFGGLDVAFNNAAVLGAMGSSTEISQAAWDETLAINLGGAFLAAKHQIPALLERPGGSLIMTSSFVGHSVGFPGMAAYAASKAGLIGLVQALAVEYGPHGLRVNALLPGGMDTAMARQFAPTEAQRQQIGALHALQRLATADEIAQAALYLASDAASFTTGTAMLIDGGISIKR